MRTAIPVSGGRAGRELTASEEIVFYEDDHGQVIRKTSEKLTGGGFEEVLACLEKQGADVLLCGVLTEEERHALALSGFLIASAASDIPEDALRTYLGVTVACDPNNTCTCCTHRNNCGIGH